MTTERIDAISRPRGAKRPSCTTNAAPKRRGRRERRVRAAPAVSCATRTKENAHEHTGTVGAFRHSLRNGFTAYAALSSATNSSCHRHRRINGLARPGWARKNLRRLDTSNGCQDHTVLPYATAPFVLHAGARSRKTALRTFAHPTLPRPPHPAPTFVTMANAPLPGRDGGDVDLIWVRREEEYFLTQVWTGSITLIWL